VNKQICANNRFTIKLVFAIKPTEFHRLSIFAIGTIFPNKKKGILIKIKNRIKARIVAGCCDLKNDITFFIYDVQRAIYDLVLKQHKL